MPQLPSQPPKSLCNSLNDCTILDNEAINIIKQLIKEGKDINEKNQFGKTPLMLAIEKHNIGLVKLLLIAGADPNIKDKSGYTAFCKAVCATSTSLVEKTQPTLQECYHQRIKFGLDEGQR